MMVCVEVIRRKPQNDQMISKKIDMKKAENPLNKRITCSATTCFAGL